MNKLQRRRMLRTVVLGFTALACMIFGLYHVWEVPALQVWAATLAAIMLVLVPALLAFVVVAGVYSWRSRRRGRRIEKDQP